MQDNPLFLQNKPLFLQNKPPHSAGAAPQGGPKRIQTPRAILTSKFQKTNRFYHFYDQHAASKLQKAIGFCILTCYVAFKKPIILITFMINMTHVSTLTCYAVLTKP